MRFLKHIAFLLHHQTFIMPQFITLKEAQAMISKYTQERENILDAPFKGMNILPVSETFDKTAIETVLNQPGCTKVRVYFGMDENLLVKAIIVGVNEQDEDILVADDEKVVENGFRCPPICPPPSRLIT
jgi:hypothetical protein